MPEEVDLNIDSLAFKADVKMYFVELFFKLCEIYAKTFTAKILKHSCKYPYKGRSVAH